MAFTKVDDEFMKKLNEIIQNNLHNPDFSMDDIVDSLNMKMCIRDSLINMVQIIR